MTMPTQTKFTDNKLNELYDLITLTYSEIEELTQQESNDLCLLLHILDNSIGSIDFHTFISTHVSMLLPVDLYIVYHDLSNRVLTNSIKRTLAVECIKYISLSTNDVAESYHVCF
jgi:hypothetical protein